LNLRKNLLEEFTDTRVGLLPLNYSYRTYPAFQCRDIVMTTEFRHTLQTDDHMEGR